MSTAPNYTPGTSFADDETNNVAGRSLVKTTSLDSEFSNISTSINTLVENLNVLQRDDGKLQDETVEPYALAEQTKALIAVAGCNPRGNWNPNTDYEFKDVVQFESIAQICLDPHNSGTEFVQGLWLPISGDGTSAANAAAAAESASDSAASAAVAASAASLSSSNATASAASASSSATSATNASNSASSASSSASSASSNAAASATSAAAAAASANSITAPRNSSNDASFSSVATNISVSPEWVKGLINRCLVLRHQETSGTDGGSISASTWTKRPLTIDQNGIAGASVSSGNVTLPAGTYLISGYATSKAQGNHRCRVRNTSGTTVSILGSSTRNGTDQSTPSLISEKTITLTASTVLVMEHWRSSSQTVDGLGAAVGSGDPEVYAELSIRKIA